MSQSERIVVWFNEVSKNDVALVGGKGANLGEMTNADIPVPPGFIVTAEAYFDFLRQTKLTGKIRKLMEDINVNDSKKLQEVAAQVRRVISNAPMPPEIAREIGQAYKKMGGGLVAVRSSATAEDLPEASFAGQQRTFLNVEGEKEVIAAVQECWASLFEARAIFYREQQGFDHFEVGLAVPVQRMVKSQTSGVMFTVEPVTNDASKVIVEAVFGLGEAIVSGEVTPDMYVIDKKKQKIINKEIAKQEWQLIKNPSAGNGNEANIKVPLSETAQTEQKLKDDEIIQLVKLAKQLEDHYQFPQDIEWAKEDSKIYIVQTRPITTIKEQTAEAEPEITLPALLVGAAASPGIASGPARIILDASQIDKVRKGDILVAEVTTPDFVPAMKRAVAIVTNRGGRTAHAAIVSRELGIPCVVGAEGATTAMTDGQIITVDGSHGKVYDGKVTRRIKTTAVTHMLRDTIKTRTKVYVNLAQPELADRVAARNVDGVGLLRAEFMVAQIGEHPSHMIKEGRGSEFVEKLAKGLKNFAKAFHPRQVVYRTTDLKTNEYRALKGGEKYEEVEENPMLGYRGASRYITDVDTFKLELAAIKKVREKYNNLWVMIPFVRTVKELAEALKIIESEGLKRSEDFKIWMMVEVPSNIILLDKFIAAGIDGISIGSNDLTQLILGIDRDNARLAEKFDERDEAVMLSLERAIKIAKKKGVTSSICGQAPSDYPELTEKLVEWGITSISVNPDVIDKTREIIASVEKRLRNKG
ncbi:MAG: phosphoenolpyruvate synthase [Dehalococcoidales bacterium]|nr:phosphoenolpyruvate synthase [Dehalococcoidales bacterium]